MFFVGYAVNTFYEEPKIEDYCEGVPYNIQVDNCDDNAIVGKGPITGRVGEDFCNCYEIDKEGTIRCDKTNPEYTKCSDKYDLARENHARTSFITLIIIGLIAIIIGGFLLKVEAVSSGIMGGGVLTLLYAAIRYWGDIPDYGRLFILGVALAVLIWIGYKKFKD